MNKEKPISSLREILEEYAVKTAIGQNILYIKIWKEDLPVALLRILECFEEMLPKEKESPKGKDCKCGAWGYMECGCNADWLDNDSWNTYRQELRKLIEEAREEIK